MYGIYNVNTVNVKILKLNPFNAKHKIFNLIGKNFILSMASGLQDLCK